MCVLFVALTAVYKFVYYVLLLYVSILKIKIIHDSPEGSNMEEIRFLPVFVYISKPRKNIRKQPFCYIIPNFWYKPCRSFITLAPRKCQGPAGRVSPCHFFWLYTITVKYPINWGTGRGSSTFHRLFYCLFRYKLDP